MYANFFRLSVLWQVFLTDVWTGWCIFCSCFPDYPFLWNPIQQFWGNTRSVDALKGFLYGKIQEHPTVLNPMWALMAELTPQPLDVLFGVNNLRKLADDVNRKVTMWFRDEWSRRVNIVATDFFLGNDLINVAIEANRNRWNFFEKLFFLLEQVFDCWILITCLYVKKLTYQ